MTASTIETQVELIPPPQPRNWALIRRQYESGSMSQRDLADHLGISRSTLMQRAMREKWSQRKKLVDSAARRLEAQLDEKALEHIKDELEPYLAKKKAEITRKGVAVSERGLKRIKQLWKKNAPEDAKFEADGARAAETFLRMARTSLGMDDGKGLAGPINLNLLTGQANVQVVGPNERT